MSSEQSIRCVMVFFSFFFTMILTSHAAENAPPPAMGLSQTIDMALDANIDARIYKERIKAAESVVKSKRTEFLPTFSASYGYTRYNEPVYSVIPSLGLTRPEEKYTLTARASQPVFAGFSIINQYKLSRLGLDAARINEALIRRDIVFEAKQIYFSVLKAEKLEAVAQEAVAMLEAQTEVSSNFHQAEMIPLNDLLKTKVELANAIQDHVEAQNSLEIARADFNLLLRRPIGTPVAVADILEPPHMPLTIQACLDEAESSRLEVAVADLEIKKGEKEVSLSRGGYYPTVTAQAGYYKEGTDWQAEGGEGIEDSSYWNAQAQAQWDFWQWGKTVHNVNEKKSLLEQARLSRENLLDEIRRDVKQAWLKADESRKNITTVRSAIVQAKEGYRISEELYREQMATATDVLDARTQLSETMTRYYTAVYDLQIAAAALDRAIGRPKVDIIADPP